MAYTKLKELEPYPNGEKLRECTSAEDSLPAPFYIEDFLRLMKQPGGCEAVKKFMARFWGEEHQVWAGIDAGQQVLEDVIILTCPPYYPPFTSQGVELFADSKPAGFPKK